MNDLTTQVKKDLLRTLIWVIIAGSISAGIYYLF